MVPLSAPPAIPTVHIQCLNQFEASVRPGEVEALTNNESSIQLTFSVLIAMRLFSTVLVRV